MGLLESLRYPDQRLTQLYWKVRGLPGQTLPEIRLFRDVLLSRERPHLQVFEWGTGHSTVYYPRLLARAGRTCEWHGVDNSPAWAEHVRRELAGTSFGSHVHVHCTPFPAFWEVSGHSVSNPPRFEACPDLEQVNEYINFPRSLGLQFDVVIVDGRFRRRCLLVAREVLREEGLVLLHDADRQHYHSSLNVYPYGRMVEGGRLPGSRHRSWTWIGALTDLPVCQGDSLVHRKPRTAHERP